MSKIEITYDDLQEVEGVDPSDIEHLKRQEDAIRNAIAKVGRSCGVRWMFSNEAGGEVFRLVAYSDRADCIAQFTRLDLAIAPDDFEKLITEGRRPCS